MRILEHVKEHRPSSHKRFNVSYILPSIKVSWQQRFQLFDELAFAANPLDEWFCFHCILLSDGKVTNKFRKAKSKCDFFLFSFNDIFGV